MELLSGSCIFCSKGKVVSTQQPAIATLFQNAIKVFKLTTNELEKIKPNLEVCPVCCHKLEFVINIHNKIVEDPQRNTNRSAALCVLCHEQNHVIINIKNLENIFDEQELQLAQHLKRFDVCTACVCYLGSSKQLKATLITRYPQLEMVSKVKTDSNVGRPLRQRKESPNKKSPPKKASSPNLTDSLKHLKPLKQLRAFNRDKKIRKDKNLYEKVAYILLSDKTIKTWRSTPKGQANSIKKPTFKIRLKPKRQKVVKINKKRVQKPSLDLEEQLHKHGIQKELKIDIFRENYPQNATPSREPVRKTKGERKLILDTPITVKSLTQDTPETKKRKSVTFAEHKNVEIEPSKYDARRSSRREIDKENQQAEENGMEVDATEAANTSEVIQTKSILKTPESGEELKKKTSPKSRSNLFTRKNQKNSPEKVKSKAKHYKRIQSFGYADDRNNRKKATIEESQDEENDKNEEGSADNADETVEVSREENNESPVLYSKRRSKNNKVPKKLTEEVTESKSEKENNVVEKEEKSLEENFPKEKDVSDSSEIEISDDDQPEKGKNTTKVGEETEVTVAEESDGESPNLLSLKKKKDPESKKLDSTDDSIEENDTQTSEENTESPTISSTKRKSRPKSKKANFDEDETEEDEKSTKDIDETEEKSNKKKRKSGPKSRTLQKEFSDENTESNDETQVATEEVNSSKEKRIKSQNSSPLRRKSGPKSRTLQKESSDKKSESNAKDIVETQVATDEVNSSDEKGSKKQNSTPLKRKSGPKSRTLRKESSYEKPESNAKDIDETQGETEEVNSSDEKGSKKQNSSPLKRKSGPKSRTLRKDSSDEKPESNTKDTNVTHDETEEVNTSNEKGKKNQNSSPFKRKSGPKSRTLQKGSSDEETEINAKDNNKTQETVEEINSSENDAAEKNKITKHKNKKRKIEASSKKVEELNTGEVASEEEEDESPSLLFSKRTQSPTNKKRRTNEDESAETSDENEETVEELSCTDVIEDESISPILSSPKRRPSPKSKTRNTLETKLTETSESNKTNDKSQPLLSDLEMSEMEEAKLLISDAESDIEESKQLEAKQKETANDSSIVELLSDDEENNSMEREDENGSEIVNLSDSEEITEKSANKRKRSPEKQQKPGPKRSKHTKLKSDFEKLSLNEESEDSNSSETVAEERNKLIEKVVESLENEEIDDSSSDRNSDCEILTQKITTLPSPVVDSDSTTVDLAEESGKNDNEETNLPAEEPKNKPPLSAKEMNKLVKKYSPEQSHSTFTDEESEEKAAKKLASSEVGSNKTKALDSLDEEAGITDDDVRNISDVLDGMFSSTDEENTLKLSPERGPKNSLDVKETEADNSKFTEAVSPTLDLGLNNKTVEGAFEDVVDLSDDENDSSLFYGELKLKDESTDLSKSND